MISKKEVEHIAKLARLGLTEKEIQKFQRELSKILDYMEKLKEVNVSKVKATSHSIKIENIMRSDDASSQPVERVNKLIEAAPEKKKGHIKVKAIL